MNTGIAASLSQICRFFSKNEYAKKTTSKELARGNKLVIFERLHEWLIIENQAIQLLNLIGYLNSESLAIEVNFKRRIKRLIRIFEQIIE